MALLGTYIDAGVQCLASGLTCVAHSLPTIPEFSVYQILSQCANPVSVPVALESYTAAAVIWRNVNGAGINGTQFLLFAHSIVR